jgi:hypothetical protein
MPSNQNVWCFNFQQLKHHSVRTVLSSPAFHVDGRVIDVVDTVDSRIFGHIIHRRLCLSCQRARGFNDVLVEAESSVISVTVSSFRCDFSVTVTFTVIVNFMTAKITDDMNN